MRSHEPYQRPPRDVIAATTLATRAGLQKIIDAKMGNTPMAENASTYVKYSSNSLASSTTNERIIKIQDIQEDPMLPPKHQLRKNRHRDPSPPAPVLREAIKPATAEEQKQWRIPSAVSHWKNPLGFTVSIEQRLAANNGGTLERSQAELNNTNFANLAEALSDADREAREGIKIRSQLQHQRLELEQREKEQRLRELADRARQEKRVRTKEDDDKQDQAQRREQIHIERRKQAEKELRLSRMGSEQRVRQLARDTNRDISDKVALGVAKATGETKTMELAFDLRLFSKAAGSNAVHSEDQVYDAPLFAGQEAVSHIYRPKASEDDAGGFADESRFEGLGKAKKLFLGVEEKKGPVEFERDV
ncbi:hypothetical protein BABINDRAFT_163041 [Babjeviella inositovora NRRL Y-12698]|uniref:Pre-mRNA-processing protein 45 n=1 Tax=Babjeviella inositovora NRRL Y-12698 TaxID=984486 RepID=A0A1E3QJX4_9ASCO|nr:uncharacterized protein BABINDRAFT_163041 [Babjeviella inositovora NRRL Y-12698]ODQ77991.1 hypothetical protein BABINDRAFT_163041 [Babjeviella inositovora NRRL Y-12698]